MRTSGEIDFRFRLKLKITLVESISANALNVPLCPLYFLLLLYKTNRFHVAVRLIQ